METIAGYRTFVGLNLTGSWLFAFGFYFALASQVDYPYTVTNFELLEFFDSVMLIVVSLLLLVACFLFSFNVFLSGIFGSNKLDFIGTAVLILRPIKSSVGETPFARGVAL